MFSKTFKPARSQKHLRLKDFRLSSYPSSLEGGPFAFDFEASGLKWQLPDFYVRSVAFSNADVVVCVDFLDCSDDDWSWFLGWIVEQKLVSFNALYDHGCLYAITGKLVEPYADCYVAFKLLGGKKSSKYKVATHSLKSAQVELLGWEAKGSDEIKEYMKLHNLNWEDIAEFDSELLLRYNGLDADSTWSLFEVIGDLVRDHWDTWGQYFQDWHREDCMTSVMLWLEALADGMVIAEDDLREYQQKCEAARDSYLKQFMEHPKLSGGIAEFNKLTVNKILDNMPAQYKKGTTIETANYKKRMEKYTAAKEANHFNTNSVQQLRWLLYEYAKIPPPNADWSTDAEALNSIGEIGQLLLNYRKMVTELKFVKQLSDSNLGGRFYPNVVWPGTDSGRVTSREDIA